MKRPAEKDEEFEVAQVPPGVRPLVDQITAKLLAYAETTSQEEDNRRYFFARGHEFAAILIEHGQALVDVKAPRPGSLAENRIGGLRQRMHEGAHREGWVLVPIETEDDVKAALELASLGYAEVLGQAPTVAVRKERRLDEFLTPPQKPAAASKGKKATSKARAKRGA
jgi:hypothetical protein